MAATDLRISYLCFSLRRSVFTFKNRRQLDESNSNGLVGTGAWRAASAPKILTFLELLNQSNRGGFRLASPVSAACPRSVLGSFFLRCSIPEWFVYPGIVRLY
jgi:hypothetical protein